MRALWERLLRMLRSLGRAAKPNATERARARFWSELRAGEKEAESHSRS